VTVIEITDTDIGATIVAREGTLSIWMRRRAAAVEGMTKRNDGEPLPSLTASPWRAR
jgi:hypothetical protein